MKMLPQSRNTDIVVQDLGKELLVYDLKTHQAFQLNETSMIVFQACADRQTFEDLKRRYKFSEDLVYLTLDLLRDKNLINDYESKFAGVSRRKVIRRVGLATMIMLPVVAAMVAPSAAMAASGSVNCIPIGGCRASGTIGCPTGCTATISIIAYFGSVNGTCGGAATPQSINCSQFQGTASIADYQRTA